MLKKRPLKMVKKTVYYYNFLQICTYVYVTDSRRRGKPRNEYIFLVSKSIGVSI